MKFRRKTASEEISGFLDQGTAVTGELRFSGTLRIDGSFHGSMTTNDILVVGEHGLVHADIRAGEVEVYGKVFGNIEGKRRVEIYPTGQVRGDIRCPMLVVQAGATFDGRCRMVEEPEREISGNTAERREESQGSLDETH